MSTGAGPDGGTADLELCLRDGAPPTAAGAAVRALAQAAGLPAERATRLRALVEQLVLEARSRECVDGASDLSVRTGHVAGRLYVEVTDRRLPVSGAESRHAESRRLVAMGFADGLHVSSHGPDGNRAAVDVVLDDQEADSLADGEVLADDVARATPADAERLEVRAMRPDDAAGLSRCVYRCYGYSYVDPMLYRPRQIRRAMRSGLVDAVVAVTPDGEVVGHCALTYERHGDPVPEAGKLVVDPRYRGHHLSERMAAVRKQEAVDAELAGFWSECVTNHPFSQREVAGTGGSETGLLIGAAPAAVTMAGLDNRTEGRHALITMYVPVLDRGPSILHVPEHHVGLLGTLVDGLGLSRRVVGGTGPATGRSSVSVSVSAPSGVAHLRVAVVGTDLVERVADHLEGLQAFDLAVIHLDLPIDGPAAAGAVQDLERLGFCWGAWMPAYTDRGDVLRLQRVGDGPVVTDHVQVAGPRGEAVRDHVLAEWRRVHRGIAP